MDAIICQNIFPDEKSLNTTPKGFYSIHSENKKRRKKRISEK